MSRNFYVLLEHERLDKQPYTEDLRLSDPRLLQQCPTYHDNSKALHAQNQLQKPPYIFVHRINARSMHRLLHTKISVLGFPLVGSRLERSLVARPAGPDSLILAGCMLLSGQSYRQRVMAGVHLILEPLVVVLDVAMSSLLLLNSRVLAIVGPSLLLRNLCFVVTRSLCILTAPRGVRGSRSVGAMEAWYPRILRALLPEIRGSRSLRALGMLLPKLGGTWPLRARRVLLPGVGGAWPLRAGRILCPEIGGRAWSLSALCTFDPEISSNWSLGALTTLHPEIGGTRSLSTLRTFLPATWARSLRALGALLPEARRVRLHRGRDPVLVIERRFRVRPLLQWPSGTGVQRFVRSAGPSGRLQRFGWTVVSRPRGARVRDEEAGEGGERRPGRLAAQGLGQGRPQRLRRGRRVLLMRRGDRVRSRVVHATAAEHERVHAHAHVRPLRLDALPHEHARALLRIRPGDPAGLRGDLVTCAQRTVAVHGSSSSRSMGVEALSFQVSQRISKA